MKRSDFNLPFGQRLMLLFCFFLICYILTFACAYLIGRLLADNAPAAMRISSLAQDIIAFIVPAVATAVLASRRPAALLCITKAPNMILVGLITVMTFISVPAQEAIIYWNNNIEFPESMAGFAALARQMEDAAAQTMNVLIGDGSTASLILNILVVGIGAAVAEELLFRGCFQRLLTTGGINGHLAVWIVAFCFSAMHMQLFGFVPRMLLGAYFGYLLLWSRNLWLPVIAHALNNIMFVVTAAYQVRTGSPDALSQEPVLWSVEATAASVVRTAAVIYCIYYICHKKGLAVED